MIKLGISIYRNEICYKFIQIIFRRAINHVAMENSTNLNLERGTKHVKILTVSRASYLNAIIGFIFIGLSKRENCPAMSNNE